jgi:hypothetical protein
MLPPPSPRLPPVYVRAGRGRHQGLAAGMEEGRLRAHVLLCLVVQSGASSVEGWTARIVGACWAGRWRQGAAPSRRSCSQVVLIRSEEVAAADVRVVVMTPDLATRRRSGGRAGYGRHRCGMPSRICAPVLNSMTMLQQQKVCFLNLCILCCLLNRIFSAFWDRYLAQTSLFFR